jgi:hypothetical protein
VFSTQEPQLIVVPAAHPELPERTSQSPALQKLTLPPLVTFSAGAKVPFMTNAGLSEPSVLELIDLFSLTSRKVEGLREIFVCGHSYALIYTPGDSWSNSPDALRL